MDNSVIAKSGWLLKQNTEDGSVRWCRSWVELYRDGYLKWYENDHSPNAEDTIQMTTECSAIKTGFQVTPPTATNDHLIRHRRACIFSVAASNNREWVFCGDNLEDMRSWQLALEQARLILPRTPFGHAGQFSLDHQRLLAQHLSASAAALSSYGTAGQSPWGQHHLPFYPQLPPYYLPAFSDGQSSVTYVPTNYSTPAAATANSTVTAPSASSTLAHGYLPQLTPSTTTSTTASTSTAASNQSHLRPDSRDVAMGLMAGAAVSSVVWGNPYFSWW